MSILTIARKLRRRPIAFKKRDTPPYQALYPAVFLYSYIRYSQFHLPYLLVTIPISSITASDTCPGTNLHLQFSPTVEGVLIRQSFPSPR